MANPAVSHRFVWCVEIQHSGGTIYAADYDMDEGTAAATTLGAVYRGHLQTDITIVEAANDYLSGIALPSLVSGVSFANAEGTFAESSDWRGTPVIVRLYDRDNDVATTEFTGVIVDEDFPPGRAVFTFGSSADDALEQPIPRQTVSTGEFADATDLGAAIPVVFGSDALVRPPLVKRDTTSTATDSGGWDYIISWHNRARVVRVFGDVDRGTPGLEALTAYDTAPGSPTYASTSTFTVTGGGDLSTTYVDGRPVEYETTASAGAALYSYITDYTAGTVTLANADLDAGLTAVKLASDYVVDQTTYTIDSEPLTALRLRISPPGGLLVQASDATITNPADVAKTIITDTDWGLSGTAAASSFTTGATAYSSAGLGSAIQGALGWDGRQRKARDVLNEILLGYARLRMDSSNEWEIVVDTTPSAAAVSFGYNDGNWDNISEIHSYRRNPLGSAIKTVELRYGIAGRATDGLASFEESDYQYTISYSTGLAFGATLTLFSPWLRNHTVAARVLDRLGKRIRYGDREIVFSAGQEGRGLEVGELVNVTSKVGTPTGTLRTVINGVDFQIYKIEKARTGVKITARSYNAAIYTDTTGTWWTTPDDANRDEPDIEAGVGLNLLPNPDGSIPLRNETVPDGTQDQVSMPGWILYDTGNQMTVTRQVDFAAIGAHTITTVTTGTDAAHTSSVPRLTAANTLHDALTTSSGFAASEGQSFIFSVYCDSAIGFKFRVLWLTSAASLIRTDSPTMQVRPNDTNGKGWKRYYGIATAPATTAMGYPEIVFLTAGTRKFDAMQYEFMGRATAGPSLWKHNTRLAAQYANGTLEIGGSADDVGARWRMQTKFSADTALSGSSVNLLDTDGNELWPAGARVFGCYYLVTEAITFSGGGTTVNLGITGNPTLFGSGLAKVALGARTVDSEMRDAQAVKRNSATHVIATPDTGAFTDGSMKAWILYMTGSAPTA